MLTPWPSMPNWQFDPGLAPINSLTASDPE
jgi:hypothetical protein